MMEVSIVSVDSVIVISVKVVVYIEVINMNVSIGDTIIVCITIILVAFVVKRFRHFLMRIKYYYFS